MLGRRLLVALFFVLAMAANAVARPCADLSPQPAAANESEDSVLTKLVGFLWHQKDIPQNSEAAPAKLYFTSSSGFSLYPTCDGNARYKSLLYYPIGLVVRDTGVRSELSGKTLWLVESEYALLMLIPEDDLTAVQPDKTYVFANGLDFPVYCSEPSGCVGDAGQAAAQKGFNLHPQFRFGVADQPVQGCAPLQITLYNAGDKRLLRADGQPAPDRYLLPCVAAAAPGDGSADAFGTQPNGQVKIVTDSEYQTIFKVPLRGDYHRLSNDLLAAFAPGTTNVKPCGETLTTKQTNEASAGLEVGGSYFILSGKVGGTITENTERTSEIGADVFMQSSAYSLSKVQPTSDDEPILTTDGTEPIVAYLTCDSEGPGLAPKKLYMVRVYNENLGDVPLILLADELPNTVAAQASGDMGPLAGIKTATPSARERGQAWQVTGYFEYFRLRDAFRSYVAQQTDVPEALTAAGDASYQRQIDYFAHLLMAVTTEPRPARN